MAPSKKHVVAAAAASLMTAATLALSTPAYADPPESDESSQEAESVEQQIAHKQEELSKLNEQYLDAKLELEKQNAAKAAADVQLTTTQADLVAAQNAVAELGAEAYKSGSLPTTVYLLAGDSPSEYIERVNQQQHVNSYYDQQISALAQAQAQTQAVKDQADAAQAAAAQAKNVIEASKSTLEKEIPELEKQLDQLTAEQLAVVTSTPPAHGDAAQPASQPVESGGAVEVTATGSAADVINYALAQRGKAYVWGGEGPGGFDCSGLVLAAFKRAGISLPHSSGAQAGMGTAVSMNALQPGDLLYGPGHVGIYIGGGMAVHAPTFGQTVTTITASYFSGARRLL